jgi:ATP-dependent Zn protease
MRKSTRKKMKADREQRQTELLQKDIFLAAVHEAGHAFAYTKLGVGVEYATIERKKVSHNGQEMFSSGFTQPCPRELTRATIEREAICALAGPAAEDAFNGHAQSGSQGDVDGLRQCALHVGMSMEEAVELVSRAYRAACELTDSNIDAVKKIAFELMTKGRIEGHVITQIIGTTAK